MSLGFKHGKTPNAMRPKGARNQISREAKAMRKAEADARQDRYEGLTHEEKLALIETRRGQSLRERYRLTFKVNHAE